MRKMILYLFLVVAAVFFDKGKRINLAKITCTVFQSLFIHYFYIL